MSIALNIRGKDVLFCREMVTEYLEQVKSYEAKILTCASRQRGAFRSHAVQRKKDAERMQANYDAQMGWLVENNYPLYQKLKASETD